MCCARRDATPTRSCSRGCASSACAPNVRSSTRSRASASVSAPRNSSARCSSGWNAAKSSGEYEGQTPIFATVNRRKLEYWSLTLIFLLVVEVARLDELEPKRADDLDLVLRKKVVRQALEARDAILARIRLHDLAVRIDGAGRDRLVLRAVHVEDRDAL